MLAADWIISEVSIHIIYTGNHSSKSAQHSKLYMVTGTSSLVLFAQFFDFLNITFLIPLLLLLMSFNLHILPEETNQLPIFSLSPSLLPYSWVTTPKLLHFAAYTSLRHLKPKPLPIFFPYSPSLFRALVSIQVLSLEMSIFFDSILPLTLLLPAPQNLVVSGLDTYSCPQTVHLLFYICLLVLF